MRFYSNEFPNIDDIVYVKFNKISTKYGIVVDLIEYNNIEGMIINSEIQKKKTNAAKLFRNKIIPCLVLNVDQIKGYVDLSYRRVLEEEKQKYQRQYPAIEKIVKIGEDILTLYEIYKKETNSIENKKMIYEQIIWKIFENNKKINNYDKVLEEIISNPQYLFKYSENLQQDFIDRYINLHKQRIKVTELNVLKDFKLQILSENGIDKLKIILMSIIPDDLKDKIKVECVASPIYRLNIIGKDNEEINNYIIKINDIVNEKIKNYNVIYCMMDNLTILKDKNYTLAPLQSYIKSF